jgi:hypothetical protein
MDLKGFGSIWIDLDEFGWIRSIWIDLEGCGWV